MSRCRRDSPVQARSRRCTEGEDYELLFTARPRTKVPAEVDGLRLTRIGIVRHGRPGEIRLNDRPLLPLGFDHFRQ